MGSNGRSFSVHSYTLETVNKPTLTSHPSDPIRVNQKQAYIKTDHLTTVRTRLSSTIDRSDSPSQTLRPA